MGEKIQARQFGRYHMIEKQLQDIITRRYHKKAEECGSEELYYSLLELTKEITKERGYNEGERKLYYISAEFLIGKLLSNNLINLGLFEDCLLYTSFFWLLCHSWFL